MNGWPGRAVALARARALEFGAALVAFAVYAAFSGPMLLRQSHAPHFVYQAEGFLRGRLSIPGPPPNLNDWVWFGHHWYVSFPPFPAVLMLPFVAVEGLGFNDVFFTVCLAALAVSAFVAMLKALREDGQHAHSDRDIAVLAAFFAFGTVFFYSSIRGEVWFTAHVVGVLLTSLFVILSLRGRHPWLAGILLGCAALSRADLVFAALFFALETLSSPDGGTALTWGRRLHRALPQWIRFAVPVSLILGAAFWMNDVRFGHPLEFGHALLFDNRVNARVHAHGLFSLAYLPGNFRSAFLLLPSVQWHPFRVGFDGNGMSMLLTTPLLLLLPFGVRQTRSTFALAATAVVTALPGLLYMNNGWYQFGYRFSNDYLPYLFALFAVGGRPLDKKLYALGAVGVVVCTWGALVFNRF